MIMNVTLFLLLGLVPCVLADDWEDFTNNLATDLAPLITLFGERLTKQFLSESTSLVDNFIFALSPLGVLTAVVSVIRICGSSSLRAFVGRAQEGPAEAEGELLPCVSESTAELFNDGGISRVFGRPRIVEIVAWENDDEASGEKSIEIGTLRDALATGAWSCKGPGVDLDDIKDPNYMPEMDIPNLSLNKGIKQKDTFWFYAAAILGGLLQIGVLVYAAVTVFVCPKSFTVNGGPVDAYAFPFYVIGTSLLFMGMFGCAVIIERSSKEHYFKPKKPSKLYWLQPGDQDVGDQVFNSFLAVKEGSGGSMTKKLRYIKSRRVMGYDNRYAEVYTALLMTLLGFIFQFIGERGLHSSVILAQLGSTFIMSVLRTILRTERMSLEENKLRNERELVARKQQELDSFAFYLEELQSFNFINSPPHDVPSDTFIDTSENSLVRQTIKTRARLADLTKGENSRGWDNIPIRKVAQNLANTMETTMDLLSSWGVNFEKEFEFPLSFECKSSASKSDAPIFGVHSIRLRRLGDVLRWRVVDADGHATTSELEAIIGLWTWSLYKSNEEWSKPFYRMVGFSESEAGKAETYLYFHKWIFRQTEATLVTRKMVDVPRRLFGYDSEIYPDDNDILAVKTESELEVMVAQDVYIQFLRFAFPKMQNLGGEVDMILGLQSTWTAQHTRVNDLAQCFEDNNLGSREDALLCIIPPLRQAGLLPELVGDSPSVRKHVEKMIHRADWDAAFSLLNWICQRSRGGEFEISVFSLAYLCRRAMINKIKSIREEGVNHASALLQRDPRLLFFQSRKQFDFSNWTLATDQVEWWEKFTLQFGWMCRQLSFSTTEVKKLEPILQHCHVSSCFANLSNLGLDEEEANIGLQTLKLLLTTKGMDLRDAPPDTHDEAAFRITLFTRQNAINYWLMVRFVELSEEVTEFAIIAWTLAGKYRVPGVIGLLKRYGVDINASLPPRGHSPILHFIEISDVEAVRTLLLHGANPDGSDHEFRLRPILMAGHHGNIEILDLLLNHGANIDIVDDSTGVSALFYACSYEQFATIHWLLSHGADINTGGPDNTTPLRLAVINKNVTLLHLLLEYDPDVNVRDSFLDTPLMLATANKSTEMMGLLLDKDADPSLRNQLNLDALSIARELNFIDGIRLLEQAIGVAPNNRLSGAATSDS